jgi:hypothetical protein
VKTKTIKMTDKAMEEAFAALERAEGEDEYAKWLGERVRAGAGADRELEGLVATLIVGFIPRAMTNPAGRIASILNNCGLLDPEFIKSLNYEFSATQSQAPLPGPRGPSRPQRSY